MFEHRTKFKKGIVWNPVKIRLSRKFQITESYSCYFYLFFKDQIYFQLEVWKNGDIKMSFVHFEGGSQILSFWFRLSLSVNIIFRLFINHFLPNSSDCWFKGLERLVYRIYQTLNHSKRLFYWNLDRNLFIRAVPMLSCFTKGEIYEIQK